MKNNKSDNVLKHVVLVQFKRGTTTTQIKEVDTAFRDLEKKIDVVLDFSGGKNNSQEQLDQGYSHGYVLSFKNERERDVYLVHQAHLAFVDILNPVLEKVCVLDFWSY